MGSAQYHIFPSGYTLLPMCAFYLVHLVKNDSSHILVISYGIPQL